MLNFGTSRRVVGTGNPPGTHLPNNSHDDYHGGHRLSEWLFVFVAPLLILN